MLTILGPRHRFCDRVSRRDFLSIGGLALGGASLPQILRAEAQAGKKSHKAIIMVFLTGGPPHLDMVDLKPDAPAEIRGEFRPIRTSVPGIHICEHLPRLAAMMDRCAIIRTIVGAEHAHASFQCLTGRKHDDRLAAGGWPCLGSVLSRLEGPTYPSVAPFVGLSPKMQFKTWENAGQPGFLGPAHAPFRPNAEGTSSMILQGANLAHLADRRALLASFDRLHRGLHDASARLREADQFTRQAFDILGSSRLMAALDLEREDSRVRDRYGRGSPEPYGHGDAGPLLNDYFLAARRLVEAGVRCVTLSHGRWDFHGNHLGDTCFVQGRQHMEMLDRGLSALLEDLRQRGLENDVSVVVWGEFGRTPRINPQVGRDHWPDVSFALLAGGGLRTGQVIGRTNRLAEVPADRPVTFAEVFATLYHSLGIDTNRATLNDLSGRPQYLVENHAQPLRELI